MTPFAKHKVLIFWLVSVAEQMGYSLTLRATRNTGSFASLPN